MNPNRFQPSLDSLGERITPASIPLTLSPSNVVVTLPTSTPSSSPPAPGRTDDAFENNDTRGMAKSLGTLTGPSLNATVARAVSNLKLMDSADWFSFTTTKRGAVGSSASIRFNNAMGNLDLRVYDSAGRLLGVSQGNGNVEAVSLAGRPPATYYMQIVGRGGARNPSYALGVKQAVQTTTRTVPPVAPPAPPAPPPVPPAPPAGGFDIALRFSGLTATQQAIFQRAAARWEQVIVGDLPNAVYQGIAVDDLLIDARAVTIDGRGGILGQAAPDVLRTTGAGLPIHGFMQFDTADLAILEAGGDLYSTVLHEMGHVLGFGTLWQSKNLVIGFGGPAPLYVGAQGVAAYNQVFNGSGTTVPVEPFGGTGTAGVHWSEVRFGTELMTGFLNPGVLNPLSRVTVAAMADLGYAVNFAAADPYTPIP